MKILAVDYGRARTGLALSDETGTLARPVGIVPDVASERGLDALVARVEELQPERIVVGMPLTLRGEHGEQAAETVEFIRRLEARCRIPIETYDERFTTSLAARTPRRPRRGSRGPEPDDARAAAHLLTGYLDRLAASSR